MPLYILHYKVKSNNDIDRDYHLFLQIVDAIQFCTFFFIIEIITVLNKFEITILFFMY